MTSNEFMYIIIAGVGIGVAIGLAIFCLVLLIYQYLNREEFVEIDDEFYENFGGNEGRKDDFKMYTLARNFHRD